MECTVIISEVEGILAKMKWQNTHPIGSGEGLWAPLFPGDLRLSCDIHPPWWSNALLLAAGIPGKLSSGTFLAQARAGIAAD